MIPATLSFLKEFVKSENLILHLSAATAFIGGLLLFWYGLNIIYVTLVILSIFSSSMSMSFIIKRIIIWKKNKNKQKIDRHIKKMGSMGKYRYSYKAKEPWPDKDYEGLGWIICVNDSIRAAFLETPVCLECKTDLLIKNNSKCNGFYLECPDCVIKFDVDDIGKTRHLANARLQGDIRKNPQKYFLLF